MTADDARTLGYRRAVKVYISKLNQPPIYVPPCWVKVTGERVDIICDEPFDLVQAKVAAITCPLAHCIIGWEEPQCVW